MRQHHLANLVDWSWNMSLGGQHKIPVATHWGSLARKSSNRRAGHFNCGTGEGIKHSFHPEVEDLGPWWLILYNHAAEVRLLLLVIPFTEPRRECCSGYHQGAALFPVSRHELGHVSETTWERMQAKDVFQPQLGCSLAEGSLFRGAKWAILENWVIMVYSQPLLLLGADSGLFPPGFLVWK